MSFSFFPMPSATAWFLYLSPERTAGEVGPHRHRRGVRGWPGLTAWMPSEGVSHMDVASRPVTKRDTESRGYREAARATGGAGGVGGAAASAPNPFACYRVPLSHERIANGTIPLTQKALLTWRTEQYHYTQKAPPARRIAPLRLASDGLRRRLVNHHTLHAMILHLQRFNHIIPHFNLFTLDRNALEILH